MIHTVKGFGIVNKAEIDVFLELSCYETDSGLDVDAIRFVAKGIEEWRKLTNGSLLIITHTTKILEGLNVDKTHILVKGHIVKTGDGNLFKEINEKGFEEFIK